MIEVSQEYKNIANSRIRPRLEPEIKVSGLDEQGNEVEIVWTAKNITGLGYKRGIDPLGRQLPFMELTWTEVYSGDLNEQSFPRKYNNIAKYMKVELSFYQNLSFFNNWKAIYNSGTTWKDIFSITWKQLKDNVLKEKITFPYLFLTAKPTYKGKTITWKAVDILSFLEEQQKTKFVVNAPIINPMRVLLLNERGNFMNSQQVFDAITESNNNMKAFSENVTDTLEKDIIVDGKTKDLLSDYAQLNGWYLDFSKGGIKIVNPEDRVYNGGLYLNTMLEYPEIQANPTVSSYSFKSYHLETNEEKKYTKKIKSGEKISVLGADVYKVNFDGYGQLEGVVQISALTYAIENGFLNDDSVLNIIPISWNSQDNVLINSFEGETFCENISCNIYDKESQKAINRFNRITRYFDNSRSVNVKCLSNLSLEAGDYVSVELNIKDNYGQPIVQSGQIVQMELSYNGVVKQNLIIHLEQQAG